MKTDSEASGSGRVVGIMLPLAEVDHVRNTGHRDVLPWPVRFSGNVSSQLSALLYSDMTGKRLTPLYFLSLLFYDDYLDDESYWGFPMQTKLF